MALTERTVISQITIDETGSISVRESRRILKGDEVVSETFHRHVVAPDDDDADEDPQVRAIRKVVLTPDLVKAAVARRAAAEDQ